MESLTLVTAVALIFVFTSVYMVARTIFHQEETRSAKQLLGEEEKSRKARNVIIKYSRPFFSRYVVPIVSDLKIDKYRKAVKRKLISAGMLEEFTPDELLSFKLFLIIGFPVFLFGVNYLGEFGLPVYIYPISSVLGFFYPDLMLSGESKKRQLAVRRSMPFIVDLLALSTEAGLDFMGALGKVVEKAKPNPLIEELEQMMKEVQVGSTRAEALKEMAVRLNMQEVSSFVSILVSADQMGASIGKVLRQQSEQIRIQRFLNAEKEGAKSQMKLFLPMFMLILPAIMLTIFGPFFLSMGGSLF